MIISWAIPPCSARFPNGPASNVASVSQPGQTCHGAAVETADEGIGPCISKAEYARQMAERGTIAQKVKPQKSANVPISREETK